MLGPLLLCHATLCCCLAVPRLSAQALRVRATPTPRPLPNLILGGTLSMTASPAIVNFALVSGGPASGDSTVVLTTGWTGVSGALIVLNVYGYFSSATQALTNTTNASFAIPSASVSAAVSGTNSNLTGFNPFNQITPFSIGSGLNLVALGSLLTLGSDGSFSNGLNLKIDLTSQPTLPAGTYTGTLNVVAQAL
jgi:hypothetical protein